MMPPTLGKVTAFITRRTNSERELLHIQHPHAGIQIPAGTLEPGERPETAILREAEEETGLNAIGTAIQVPTISAYKLKGIFQ
jgi:8-oxo-dGTP pyrophosphatase MutT (NUDIX family)